MPLCIVPQYAYCSLSMQCDLHAYDCCRVKRSVDVVKKIYFPLRKHILKPGNQTTWFIDTPLQVSQHQSPKINGKSDATPPKSPSRSNNQATVRIIHHMFFYSLDPYFI